MEYKLIDVGGGYWAFFDEPRDSILHFAFFRTKESAEVAREAYIDEFNKEVDDYNKLLAEHNTLIDDFNELLDDFNEYLELTKGEE